MKHFKIKTLVFSLVVFNLMAPELQAQENIPSRITLVFEDRLLALDFKSHPELLQQTPRYYLVIGKTHLPVSFGKNLPLNSGVTKLETEFETTVNPEALAAFFRTTSLVSQRPTEPVKLRLSGNNVVFSGKPTTGYYEIDAVKLSYLLNTALQQGDVFVRVPAERTFSPVVASEALKDRGIESVIAIGRSDFTGSSDARVQNILAAVRKFNGLIIPQGRTFSFNSTLKEVTQADGFVPELVIKGSDTEKELGGGVCQVSTTLFRAVFTAGMPLLDRRNHSYAVPYYKPHGLDATIYLGGQDFRFLNDTSGDIAMQAFVSDENLYFVFYGQDDGRKVAVEGPFISDYRAAPEPVYIETDKIAVGDLLEASPSHDGFAAQWVRRVWKPGEQPQEEVLKSYYRPWAARIWQGVETLELATDENESVIEPVKTEVQKTALNFDSNLSLD